VKLPGSNLDIWQNGLDSTTDLTVDTNLILNISLETAASSDCLHRPRCVSILSLGLFCYSYNKN